MFINVSANKPNTPFFWRYSLAALALHCGLVLPFVDRYSSALENSRYARYGFLAIVFAEWIVVALGYRAVRRAAAAMHRGAKKYSVSSSKM
jgi:hypothetical protein